MQPRRTWIDFDLATSDLSDNAFRVMVYLLLHANKNSECWPSLATIAEQTHRSRRCLDFAISELKSRGFIKSSREGNQGKGQIRYTLTTTPSATDCARSETDQAQHDAKGNNGPSAKNDRPSAKSEETKRKKCADLAQKVNPPLTTPYICEQGIEQGIEQGGGSGDVQQVAANTTSTSEPFESDLGSNLPDFRPTPRLKSRPRIYLKVELGDIQNDFNRILGIRSDQIFRKIDQEMVDSGFVKWALGKSETKDEPFSFFLHLVKEEWRDGAWSDPDIAKRQKEKAKADETRIAEMEFKLQEAKNLMEMAKKELAKGACTQEEHDHYVREFDNELEKFVKELELQGKGNKAC